MKVNAGRISVVAVTRSPLWHTVPGRLAVEHLRRSSIAISEAPSPFHIYFHGNPEKAFCSLKTTFALSSCKLALSRAERVPAALNGHRKEAEFGWAVVVWEALPQERAGNLQVTCCPYLA